MCNQEKNCICCLCNKVKYLELLIRGLSLKGMQASLNTGTAFQLDADAIVPFNNIVMNQSNITSSNGVFTVHKKGNYLVNYFLNIDGTESKVNVKLACNNIPSEATYAVQGQITGIALLSLNVGDTISITNANSEIIVIPDIDTQGGITITYI